MKFRRVTSRCGWKGKIILIYAIALGLLQVVGETCGEVSYIDVVQYSLLSLHM